VMPAKRLACGIGQRSRMLPGMARKRKHPAAVTLGRLGGRASRARLTATERAEAARQAAHARWAGTTPEERSIILRRAVRARWAKAKRKKASSRG
jgi:hypothetical protein